METLMPNDVRGVLDRFLLNPWDVFAKYHNFRLQDFIEQNSNGRHCPGRGCEYMFLIDNENEDEQQQHRYNCRKCQGSFCLSCNEKWHDGTCEEEKARLLAAGRNDGEEELKVWAAKEGTKHCPNCNNMVCKAEGCNAMTCRCGIIFCWLCVHQVKTRSDGEKPKAGLRYCNCKDWGIEFHRDQPAGQAAGPNRPDILYR